MRLGLWGLVEYDRVLYLDTDMLVLGPLGLLFSLPDFYNLGAEAIGADQAFLGRFSAERSFDCGTCQPKGGFAATWSNSDIPNCPTAPPEQELSSTIHDGGDENLLVSCAFGRRYNVFFPKHYIDEFPNSNNRSCSSSMMKGN